MATWSKDDLLEFIDIYRKNECIWKVKTKEYHNREMREAAYSELLEFVHTIEPRANKDTILKKINNLRSSFRKEWKKVKQDQMSGRSKVPYIPKLWYYNEMLFLVDQKEDLEETQNLDGSDQEEAKVEIITDPLPPLPPTIRQASQPEPGPSRAPTANAFRRQPMKRFKHMTPTDQILVTVGQRLLEAKKEDQYDVFGKLVAQKLRQLDPEQRIFAQKLINDSLFEAELGCLSRNATINNTGYSLDYGPPSNTDEN